MFNSLRRNGGRSKSKPALVSFVRNSNEDQENWVNQQPDIVIRPLDNGRPAHYNINPLNEPNRNYYHTDNAYTENYGNCYQRQYGGHYPPSQQQQSLYDNQRNTYLQDLNTNEPIDERKKCQNKMKTRRSSSKSSGQSYSVEGRHPKMEKYFSQTGTISKTVSGVMKRRKHIVFLGLDGSGKTTLLMQLKYKCHFATTPTVGFNHEKVGKSVFRFG